MAKLGVTRVRDCWICFSDENHTTLTIVDSEKVLKNCGTYLDASIILNSFENEATVSCCRYCYESAHQLTLMEEQVEKLQKEISDLSFMFSKNVMERRSGWSTAKDEIVNPIDECLIIHKNSDGLGSTVMFENINTKTEVIESGPEELLSETEVETGLGNIVTNIVSGVDSDIPNITQNEQTSSKNTVRDRKTTKTSIDGLLKCLKTPIIQLERLQHCRIKNLSNINSGAVEENIKCEPANNCSRKTSTKLLFKCPEISCPKSFKSKSKLVWHQKIHSGDRPHKCSFCTKSFCWVSQLKDHERIHTGERPFKCSLCTKSFKTSSQLKEHDRSHSGEKPHKCPEISCLKYFASRNMLIRHQRIHSGEKPFKCSFCSKSFRQTGHLNTHEKTHSEETPYKCSNCEKRFKMEKNLKQHRRRTHGEINEEFILS